MNKRANTFVFILVASFVNIVLTLVILLALFLAVARFLPSLLTSPDTGKVTLIAVFILSVAASALAYRGLLALFRRKVDMEKHFDPLIGGNRGPRRSD